MMRWRLPKLSAKQAMAGNDKTTIDPHIQSGSKNEGQETKQRNANHRKMI